MLPDVRGLFRFYEQLAERFAAAGHPAIAIDYFGRTAGLGPRDEDFEYMPHVQQTTPETIALDVDTALAFLRRRPASSARSRSASASAGRSRSCRPPRATTGSRASSASTASSAARGVIERAPDAKVPVLGLFGGDDDHIPQRADRRVRRRAAGGEARSRSTRAHRTRSSTAVQEQYKDESQDAWERILGFITELEAPVA